MSVSVSVSDFGLGNVPRLELLVGFGFDLGLVRLVVGLVLGLGLGLGTQRLVAAPVQNCCCLWDLQNKFLPVATLVGMALSD